MLSSENFIPIVLCAGFGTRLKPLTQFIPKPACPLGRQPLAAYAIKELICYGFKEIHCNSHYLHKTLHTELKGYLDSENLPSSTLRFWYEKDILETGGGIARIYKELIKEDPKKYSHKDLLVISGDILSHCPFPQMAKAWQEKGKSYQALLGTRELEEDRPDVTWVNDSESEIIGFGTEFNKLTYIGKLFNNHQIIDRKLVIQSPVTKSSSVSLFYKKALSLSKKIANFNDNDSFWMNVGCLETYLKALDLLKIPKTHYSHVRVYKDNKVSLEKELTLKVNTLSERPVYAQMLIQKKLSQNNYKDCDTQLISPENSLIIAYSESCLSVTNTLVCLMDILTEKEKEALNDVTYAQALNMYFFINPEK